MAKRLIDTLSEGQRYTILSEIIEDLTDDERSLLEGYFAPQIQSVQDAVSYMAAAAQPNDEDMVRIAKEIANKRNNMSKSSGVEAKKLI